jgi:hypothetical protein
MADSTQVYVKLLDEATDCWRPVDAVHEGEDRYRLVGKNADPEDEHWEFESGSLVRCRPHVFADGESGLVVWEKVGDV